MSRCRPAWRTAPLAGRTRQHSAGFSLLELMTVLVVMGILLVLTIPIYDSIVARAQKAKCIGNLRSLHVATGLYIRDNQHWPQLAPAIHGDTAAAQAWIDAYRPYGLAPINWICPAIQKALQSPDLSDPEQVRVDYFATSFNTKPNSPFAQARQPWFAECADVHGNGQEIIFPDGHIEESGDLMRGYMPAPSANPGH